MKPPYRYFNDDSIEEVDLIAQLRGLAWQKERLFIYGKWVQVPREVAFYGDKGVSYTYSNVCHQGLGWPPILRRLREKAQQLAQQRFNSVLLNYYHDGNDYMGWHSDDEAVLGPAPYVAMLSLGATRDFVFRLKADPSNKHSVALTHQHWLIMLPPTQALWQHTLPKRKNIQQARISLTFRLILPV